jgi:hypothetical protein
VTLTVAEELQWLKDHPDFRERPATLMEFLGPDYLNIEDGVRERIKEVLAEIMGDEVNPVKPTKYMLAIFTGAIGIGKTTVASIVLPYLVHWVKCLHDPQKFFGLLPGSRIAFMLMSTKASQAKEVLFSDIKARIAHSPWFKRHPYDPSFKNQIRFEGEIWILPGDSTETAFEGYNILGGILDEADSHKVTETKDYAEVGYETIYNRIYSRFKDRGFLLIIGQMKEDAGFAGRKFKEFNERDDAVAFRLTIWESLGEDEYRDPVTGEVPRFWYDTKRKQIVPDKVISAIQDRSHLLHIPKLYETAFRTGPEKALKDLAGIPPKVQSPFISLVDKVYGPRNRWLEHHRPDPPVDPDGRIAPWFIAPDTLPRVGHLDIAYSGDNGDGLGFAMGHIPHMVTIDGEDKPYIVIDLLYRMKALPGREIFLGDARQVIYNLRNERKFKLNAVTMDGFQSVDTRQQFTTRRILSFNISVDKEVHPYHDLREALYEDRIEFPPYEVHRNPGDAVLVDILTTELEQLMDLGRKIDHPLNGSKDVADAVAAVVSHLMGNTSYHRKKHAEAYQTMATPLESPFSQHRLYTPPSFSHPAYIGHNPGAPIPPKIGRP